MRFAGHVRHVRALLEQDDGKPCGKRLEFLLQEMHREVNTMGSKSSDLEISEAVLAIKSDLEKMREQIQNLE